MQGQIDVERAGTAGTAVVMTMKMTVNESESLAFCKFIICNEF